jgi:hypothetical protein
MQVGTGIELPTLNSNPPEGNPPMKSFAWLLTLTLVFGSVAVSNSVAEEEEGFVSLFNGKDLTGWKGDKRLWSVEDGAITGKTDEKLSSELKYNTFLVADKEVGNFELRAQFKIVGGNSGIQYRSTLKDKEKFIVGGYQADIDSSPTYSGINYEEGGRGILAERGQKVEIASDGKKAVDQFGNKEELQKLVKKEDWNDYKVVANGNRLQHYINGQLMSETIDGQSDKAAKTGVLALQCHAGPPMKVQFKNIRIKELKQ